MGSVFVSRRQGQAVPVSVVMRVEVSFNLYCKSERAMTGIWQLVFGWPITLRHSLRSAGRDSFNRRKIGQQFIRNIVTLLKPGQAVVRHLDFSGGVFPDQDFKRQIERAEWRSDHYGSPRPGISEDQQFGRTHSQAGFFGFSVVIDDRKESDVFGSENGFYLFHRFRDGKMA